MDTSNLSPLSRDDDSYGSSYEGRLFADTMMSKNNTKDIVPKRGGSNSDTETDDSTHGFFKHCLDAYSPYKQQQEERLLRRQQPDTTQREERPVTPRPSSRRPVSPNFVMSGRNSGRQTASAFPGYGDRDRLLPDAPVLSNAPQVTSIGFLQRIERAEKACARVDNELLQELSVLPAGVHPSFRSFAERANVDIARALGRSPIENNAGAAAVHHALQVRMWEDVDLDQVVHFSLLAY